MTTAALTSSIDVDTIAGRFAVDPADVITFPHGVPGFESCRRFVLVTGPALDPFTCLHGLDGPSPSFLALDPHRIDPAYQAAPTGAERHRLGAGAGDTLLWLAVVRVDGDAMHANLRAPIVVHPRRMLGLQLLGADSPYPTDHPIAG